jgi:hypothetical protein
MLARNSTAFAVTLAASSVTHCWSRTTMRL